jgi:RimJ/RimL family protein N-acetyltransferase
MRDVIEIETQRLRLRPVRMSDARCVARLAGDVQVARNVASIPVPYLDCAAEGWIMTLNARKPLGEEFVFAIEDEAHGLIGTIGAHKGGHAKAAGFEIGYWIGRPYWGQGYATEALRGFVSEARVLGPLEAGHFVDNPASGRVLEKGGFAYTGETQNFFSLGRGAKAPVRRMRYQQPARASEGRKQCEMSLH